MALNAAARICTLDTIYSSQSACLIHTHHDHVIHVYQDRSDGREEDGGTYNTSINKGIFEIGVTGEQLGVQEGGVGDGVEEGDVDRMSRGEVVDGDGGKGHWVGEGAIVRRGRGEVDRGDMRRISCVVVAVVGDGGVVCSVSRWGPIADPVIQCGEDEARNSVEKWSSEKPLVWLEEIQLREDTGTIAGVMRYSCPRLMTVDGR